MSNLLEEAFYKLLKSMHERGLLKPPKIDGLIVGVSNVRFDTGELRRRWPLAEASMTPDPEQPSVNFQGIQVRLSNYVPKNSMWLVSEHKGFPCPSILEHTEFEKRFMAHLERFFWRDARPYPWHRWTFETVRQWGERLDKRGLLDDPVIRWEYQKAVWRAFADTLLMLWRRS